MGKIMNKVKKFFERKPKPFEIYKEEIEYYRKFEPTAYDNN